MKIPVTIKISELPKWKPAMTHLPEPELSAESGSLCSDWVAEWEAALSHVEKAIAATPLAALHSQAWTKASMVMRYLEDISVEVRGHSATDKLSDSRDARSQEEPRP